MDRAFALDPAVVLTAFCAFNVFAFEVVDFAVFFVDDFVAFYDVSTFEPDMLRTKIFKRKKKEE